MYDTLVVGGDLLKREDALKLRTDIKKMIVITGVLNLKICPMDHLKTFTNFSNDGVRRTRGGKINSLATIQ